MDGRDPGRLDEVFEGLADRRRRLILTVVSDAGREGMPIDDLVDVVVDRVSNSSPDREAIAAALHHVHLPKLADADLIDLARDEAVVSTTDRTRLAMSYLELARFRGHGNDASETGG